MSVNPPRAPRILVVDDCLDTNQTFPLLLALWGYEAKPARSGAEAPQVAPTFRPEVVLLDIQMPRGPDGWEVARRLRRQPETAHALLIALSGHGQAQDHQRSFQSGFDHHFTKPCDPSHLQQLLSLTERCIDGGVGDCDHAGLDTIVSC